MGITTILFLNPPFPLLGDAGGLAGSVFGWLASGLDSEAIFILQFRLLQ
jgi:hypothetical protein